MNKVKVYFEVELDSSNAIDMLTKVGDIQRHLCEMKCVENVIFMKADANHPQDIE